MPFRPARVCSTCAVSSSTERLQNTMFDLRLCACTVPLPQELGSHLVAPTHAEAVAGRQAGPGGISGGGGGGGAGSSSAAGSWDHVHRPRPCKGELTRRLMSWHEADPARQSSFGASLGQDSQGRESSDDGGGEGGEGHAGMGAVVRLGKLHCQGAVLAEEVGQDAAKWRSLHAGTPLRGAASG
jgi:hypothetical protein